MNPMTFDEKIGQTVMYGGDWNKTGITVSEINKKYGHRTIYPINFALSTS